MVVQQESVDDVNKRYAMPGSTLSSEKLARGIATLPIEIQDMIIVELSFLATSTKGVMELSFISWRFRILLSPFLFSRIHIRDGNKLNKVLAQNSTVNVAEIFSDSTVLQSRFDQLDFDESSIQEEKVSVFIQTLKLEQLNKLIIFILIRH